MFFKEESNVRGGHLEGVEKYPLQTRQKWNQ